MKASKHLKQLDVAKLEWKLCKGAWVQYDYAEESFHACPLATLAAFNAEMEPYEFFRLVKTTASIYDEQKMIVKQLPDVFSEIIHLDGEQIDVWELFIVAYEEFTKEEFTEPEEGLVKGIKRLEELGL